MQAGQQGEGGGDGQQEQEQSQQEGEPFALLFSYLGRALPAGKALADGGKLPSAKIAANPAYTPPGSVEALSALSGYYGVF